MAHTDRHPAPVDGCFGCKVAGVGWQGLQSAAGGRRSDPTKVTPVIGEEGPRVGSEVGRQREHWDGRSDAKVFAPTVVSKMSSEEHV